MVTQCDERLLDIFKELASIDAISHNEKPVADYIKSFLSNLNLSYYEDGSKGITKSNTGNLLSKIGNGGEFLLLSHMDTARSTKGIKFIQKEDRLESDKNTVLGVDNRAGIAAILYSVEKIIKNKINVTDFTIAFTTCEETSLEGAKNLEISNKINRAFVFDSYLRPGKYISHSCGAARFDVKIIGEAAHSGIAPEKGINTFSMMIDAFNKVNLGWLDSETNANIGFVKGGTGINVVPEEIEITGEIRSRDTKKVEKYLDELQKILNTTAEKYGGSVEFKYKWDFRPYHISNSELIIKEINEAVKSVKLTPEICESWGGSDANSLNARNIKAINLGIGAQNPHSNEEFILYEDLQKTHEILMELVKK